MDPENAVAVAEERPKGFRNRHDRLPRLLHRKRRIDGESFVRSGDDAADIGIMDGDEPDPGVAEDALAKARIDWPVGGFQKNAAGRRRR